MNRTTEKIIGFSLLGFSMLLFVVTIHMTMTINLEGTQMHFMMGIFILAIPATFGILTLIYASIFLLPSTPDSHKGEHKILR